MFTFCICTYNHSKFIVSHLESIKYIIDTYGYHGKLNILICDDSSKDDTVNRINCWIKANGGLFLESKIIVNDYNLGTVNNFMNLIDNIDTKYFKLVAGDDCYSYHDVVSRYMTDSFLIGFTLPFVERENFELSCVNDIKYVRQKLFSKVNSFSFIKKYVLSNNSLSGPGAGYNISWLKDPKLKGFISDFKYIEDRPTWRFIFENYDPEIELELKPYVLHRGSVGVTSINNEVHKYYLKDLNKLDLLSGQGKSNLTIFIDNIKYKIMFKFFHYCGFMFKSVRHFENLIHIDLPKVEEHLKYIKNMSENFENDYSR